MKKSQVIGSLFFVGLLMTGCNKEQESNNTKLIKLENINPTIKQEHFNALISKIEEKIANKDFQIYSIENAFNEPFKSKITEKSMNKLLQEKAENRLTRDTNIAMATSVLVVNKKDKTDFFIMRIACEDKFCNNPKIVQWK